MLFSFNPRQPVQTAPRPLDNKTRQPHLVLQAGHLNGKKVRVNRGGSDSIEGILLAIAGDYLVILSDSKICYVNGAHVRNIAGSSTDGGKSVGGRSGGRSAGLHKSFIHAPDFQALLSRLRHKHIQINSGSPEKLDGFLAEVAKDNVLLIVESELVRIPIFYIKTVRSSAKRKNNHTNNNKSSGIKTDWNKSGGNRSGGSKTVGNKSVGNRIGGNRTWGSRTLGSLFGGSQGRNNGRPSLINPSPESTAAAKEVLPLSP